MSLLDKIKDFGLKKVVAPAIIAGASLIGYQGQAQEAGDYQLRNTAQMETFTLDHDNDGHEDMYIVTKNPYENQLEFYEIANLNGKRMARKPIKIDNWNVPSSKNRHFEIFTLDHDNNGYKDIYIATINQQNQIEFYEIANLNGKRMARKPIKIDNWTIPIQDKTSFSISTSSINKYKHIYVFTKQFNNMKTQTYEIANINGERMARKPIKIDNWNVSLGSPKN
jgi:hypothetical protein